jgi:hypothetical protein
VTQFPASQWAKPKGGTKVSESGAHEMNSATSYATNYCANSSKNQCVGIGAVASGETKIRRVRDTTGG